MKINNVTPDKEALKAESLKISITTPDRILRELDIIDIIFKAQYLKYDPTDPSLYILDKTGHSGIDGKYIISVFLLSDVELFSVQLHKKEFTTRFESTSNLSLLRNQLLGIRDRAIEIRDYYNQCLTKGNKIVDEFIAKNKSLDRPEQFHERLDFLESHRSVVTISNYHLMEFYLGIDLHGNNGFIRDRAKYSYTYISDNSQLVSICQIIIDFIEKFEVGQQVPSISISERNTMPKHYDIEKRKTFETEYLNISIRNEDKREAIGGILRALHSVKKVNLTNQPTGKRELTLYPSRAFDISETEQEVQVALNNYFKGSPIDPSFRTETISGISDKAFDQIIDHMLILGKELEKFAKLNTNFDEERYRDYFIPHLNAVTQNYSARAEAFNRKGKTDILFADNKGNNVFIAECKLWKGPAYLQDAIDQLLSNYVNWRDEKVTIVVFNRDNKKFSDVIESATKTVAAHNLCLKDLGKRKDTSFSFLFRHPDDEKKTIRLELVLFNFG